MNFFRYLYLAYWSRPAHHRVLYRTLRKWPCQSIVEIGVGTADRTVRLLELAAARAGTDKVRYTGIDLFELRSPERSGLTLKQAFQKLQHCGARVQLAPGDPFPALSRLANSLRQTDLLIVQADQDAASLEQAWFLVPRMLHAGSKVFVERTHADGPRFDLVPLAEIEDRAKRSGRMMRRAA